MNVQGPINRGGMRRLFAVLFVGMVCTLGPINCRTASGSGQVRAEKISVTVETIREAVNASNMTPAQKKDIGEKLAAVAKDSRTMGKDFDNVAAERDEYKEDSDTLFHIYIGCGVFVALILLALFLKFRPSILGAVGKVFSGGVAK